MSEQDDKQPQAPQVLVILQDNLATGELEIGGIQRPLEFNPNSPAHVVGKFLSENMEQICVAAVASQRPATPDVIDGDRERTIVLPGGE
jgi:hypothetical protein